MEEQPAEAVPQITYILSSTDDGKIHITFDKPVKILAFTPGRARELALQLRQLANRTDMPLKNNRRPR